MLGVTIGVGKWRRAAELAAEAARRHTGLETRVLGDAEWGLYRGRYASPIYLKLHLFELVDDEDIFYFDADAIHVNSWSPQSYAGREELVAVIDQFIGDQASSAGVPAREYFNAGVLILSRRHHRRLALAAQQFADADRDSPLFDQHHWNRARAGCGIPLHALESRFNHLRFYEDPGYDPTQTVIAHWTPHGDDPSVIEEFCRTGRLVTAANAVAEADRFIQTVGEPPSDMSGRGVVICAGGGKYLPSAWVLIRMLRRLGCDLPIQIWYRGEEERNDSWQELVRLYGVACIDAEAVRRRHPHLALGGWELKPYAILHSPFREVLLLDADNVPVRDPAYLFDSPEYRQTGAMFWPDGCRMSPSDPCWAAFGVAYRDERNFESGQLLVDKARCWRALNLCDWYNQHSYFFYRVVYGDKDTFRFAWHRLGQRFAMPAQEMGSLASTILQYDADGELIFQHRFGDKWSLSGNRRIQGFEHEDACRDFINELRKQWSAVKHITDQLSPSDSCQIEQLTGARFQLIRPGFNRWPMELAGNGYIGAGWSPQTFLWWVEEGQLVLAGDDGRATCRLAPNNAGGWEGRSARTPAMAIRLVPAGAA
jgi:hypothetical protein